MLKGGREPRAAAALDRVIEALVAMGKSLADAAMLSRTHGQPATPTTLGKELRNFATACVARTRASRGLASRQDQRRGRELQRPLAAYPISMGKLARRFVESLGLEFNPYTIQIEPHDTFAEQFDAFARRQHLLLAWTATSGATCRSAISAEDQGGRSRLSTMPHRSTPIDFENSEGTSASPTRCCAISPRSCRVALAARPVRFDRAATSGRAGHGLLAYESTLKGLSKLEADRARMLESSTRLGGAGRSGADVMRRYGLPDPTSSSRRSRRPSASTARR